MAEFFLLNPAIISSQSINNTDDYESLKFIQRKIYKKVRAFLNPIGQNKIDYGRRSCIIGPTPTTKVI